MENKGNLLDCLTAIPQDSEQANVAGIAMAMIDAGGVGTLLNDPAFDWVVLGNGIFFYKLNESKDLVALCKVKSEDYLTVYHRLNKM